MAELRGTFFSPGEPYVTRAYLHKAQDRIANETERRVHILQAQYFKRPTGYYGRHIVNQDMGSQHVIHDSGVVYGPWLEGVGSRNFPHTRFKGYSIMRKTTRAMQDRAKQLALPVIVEMCEAMNA
jgi:hypothetical protein